jgi:ribonuclease Y
MQGSYLVCQSSVGWTIVFVALALVIGAAVMYLIDRARQRALDRDAAKIIDEARQKADVVVKAAEVDAAAEHLKRQEQFQAETQEIREELKAHEKRLAKREDNLESKLDALTTKERNLEQFEHRIAEREKMVTVKQREADDLLVQQRDRLMRISNLSLEQARQELLNSIKQDVEHEAAQLVERLVNDARDTAKQKAREITITAIQRYAAEHTTDATVSTVDIPSDDMKGRVIGREGRNIRAFEKATGVDVIVDDTPGVVVVSAFDPVRREIARLSLERLVQDGRIQPGRIEELVEEVRKEVERDIIEIGKKASIEANVGGLHRKQIDLLGRLRYRTSYGQNVLRHSIEVAYLCQVMADELGLDGRLARRCGLLHDIGKAVPHDIEGGHPQIGAEICKKFNERPEVLNAIAGHHGDVESISPYTPLVMAADAISASRPGGRRESLERYIKRLEQLEDIAKAHRGVSQAYAIQAGREIRVIVDADKVDDSFAYTIARDIAKRVQEEMTYPGEVKVTVLREVRAVEYAR